MAGILFGNVKIWKSASRRHERAAKARRDGRRQRTRRSRSSQKSPRKTHFVVFVIFVDFVAAAVGSSQHSLLIRFAAPPAAENDPTPAGPRPIAPPRTTRRG